MGGASGTGPGGRAGAATPLVTDAHTHTHTLYRYLVYGLQEVTYLIPSHKKQIPLPPTPHTEFDENRCLKRETAEQNLHSKQT